MISLFALAVAGVLVMALRPSILVAATAGLAAAVLFGGALSLLGILPAALLSLAVPVAYAVKMGVEIQVALFVGISLLTGYVVGCLINILLFPAKTILGVLRGVLKLF